MDDLKKQAEELGIKVDGRWSEDRLREEIDKALSSDSDGGSKSSEPVANADRMIPVRVLRDYWTPAGERVRKGTVAEVPVEVALDGVETGALSRVK